MKRSGAKTGSKAKKYNHSTNLETSLQTYLAERKRQISWFQNAQNSAAINRRVCCVRYVITEVNINAEWLLTYTNWRSQQRHEAVAVTSPLTHLLTGHSLRATRTHNKFADQRVAVGKPRLRRVFCKLQKLWPYILSRTVLLTTFIINPHQLSDPNPRG